MLIKIMSENNLNMSVTLLSRFDQNLQRIYYARCNTFSVNIGSALRRCYFYSDFMLNAKNYQEFGIGLSMEQESLMLDCCEATLPIIQ